MKTTIFAVVLLSFISLVDAQVRVESIPEGGLQPQILVDAKGAVHLVYLKGDAKACDIRYTHRPTAEAEWAAPITVNSIPKSAIAVGTIRGAQIALGRGGSVQVVWNGAPDKTGEKQHRSALYHTRMKAGAAQFEPQRDWLGDTVALDGGASIAANSAGRVCLVWHAAQEPGLREGARLVFMRESRDDGVTFSEPKPLNKDQPGVCPCCSLRAHLDAQGTLQVLYRAAMQPEERGIAWIRVSPDGTAWLTRLDKWRIAMCPMSSLSVHEMAGVQQAAWENDGRIVTGAIGAEMNKQGPPGAKHPTVVANAQGSTLMACITGSGWMKAGELHWELQDASGKMTDSGKGGQLPVWSFAAAYALPDGSFVILR
jgi:hypothetical protein